MYKKIRRKMFKKSVVLK